MLETKGQLKREIRLLEEIIKQQESAINQHNQRIHELTLENKVLNDLFGYKQLTKTSNTSCDGLVFVRCINKSEFLVNVTSDTTMNLYDRNYNADCGKLNYRFKNDGISPKYIILEDIIVAKENCGQGSFLMECLFKVARFYGAEYIEGEFSNVDDANCTIRESFYLKHGFEIKGNKIIKLMK